MQTQTFDPVAIAREVAGTMAELCELHARTYRLIQGVCRAPLPAAPAEPVVAQVATTDPIPALIDRLEQALDAEPEPAAVPAPEPQPVATPSFHPAVEHRILDPEPAVPAEEPPTSRRQIIFDAWASGTETANQIARRLGYEQSTVSAAISIGRKGRNPKVVAGDAARRDAQVASWEAKHQAAKAAEPAPVPQPAPVPVVAPLPKPAPVPAAAQHNPKQAQFQAMLVNRVLDHYAATGDHPSVVARKLGTTLQVVEDAIEDAGPSNERVRLGNIRRAKQVRAGK